jgi:hypothetical protein
LAFVYRSDETADWAAEQVERVDDDPSGRMGFLARTYRRRLACSRRHEPFARAATSFMHWQAERGVLRPIDGDDGRGRPAGPRRGVRSRSVAVGVCIPACCCALGLLGEDPPAFHEVRAGGWGESLERRPDGREDAIEPVLELDAVLLGEVHDGAPAIVFVLDAS